MNFCQNDIPGASLNRMLAAYETYRPCFGAPFLFSRGIKHSVFEHLRIGNTERRIINRDLIILFIFRIIHLSLRIWNM